MALPNFSLSCRAAARVLDHLSGIVGLNWMAAGLFLFPLFFPFPPNNLTASKKWNPNSACETGVISKELVLKHCFLTSTNIKLRH